MNRTLLVDTGPLVALFSPADAHHAWVKEAWRVRGKLMTCDAVVAEAGLVRLSELHPRAVVST